MAYAWHPWAGRSVRVHETIERPTGAQARCSLAGAGVVRMREIPVWMLDAAACLGGCHAQVGRGELDEVVWCLVGVHGSP